MSALLPNIDISLKNNNLDKIYIRNWSRFLKMKMTHQYSKKKITSTAECS